MERPDDVVSVYRAANVTEAHLVKNLLLDAGIDAHVSEENEPFAGVAVVPPDVLVLRKNLIEAEEIVREYTNASRAAHEAESES